MAMRSISRVLALLQDGARAGSVGARAISTSSSLGDAVQISSSSDAPLLVQLPERPWGAAATLPAATVASLTGGKAGGRVAVAREAFTAFDAPPRPLGKLLRPIGQAAAAVHSSVASPESRIVVDEYEKAVDGSYKLKTIATDLLRYLSDAQVRVCLLPDVSSSRPYTSVTGATMGVRQSTNEVLMVAPTAFGFNEQAATDNSFMHAADAASAGSPLTRQVLKEFAGLHHALTEVAGVKVHLFQHSLAHGTPDACFPNNWFSTHPAGEALGGCGAGTLVLYPMKHPNRAAERRPEVIEVLRKRGYSRVLDMSVEERNKKYFEGTGVLVIDRVNGVAYVDISERADRSLAEKWASELGYKDLVTFRSTDARGKSVYHTNVMMAIGTDVAIVCAESVADAKERAHLLQSLKKTHEVVEISLAQMDALCGNALELQDGRGLPVMAMSTQAYNAFTPEQRATMRRHVADIVHAPIDTLERVGGGGVRCTLAELF